MDLQKFDSTLKAALENIEVPYDAGSWAALESRLDSLPAPDAVDKAVRPALERIETPYDTGTWATLASRMDGIARARRVRMTKLAEAAIFLLLLLNLKGFLGVVQSVTKPAAPAKKEMQTAPIAQSRQPKALKQIPAQSTLHAASEESQSLVAQLATLAQSVAATLTQTVENESAQPSANAPQPIASNASLLDPANFYSQSGIVKFPVGAALPNRPAAQVLYAGLPIAIPGIEIPKAAKPSRFYAASFGSFDKNYVREGDFSDKKNGYGGGLAVGYRKGKWGVETGLAYSQKSYEPRLDNVTYQNDLQGISFFHIDNVDADVFSVPVKATCRIAKVGKTTAHAVAGLTANFATSKSYGYQTAHYPPGPTTPPIDPNAPPLPALPNGKGLLENGGLAHNA
ncbi:MAG: hypothetical protein ACKVUS_08385, partial [Saprospiraceae bacterium]